MKFQNVNVFPKIEKVKRKDREKGGRAMRRNCRGELKKKEYLLEFFFRLKFAQLFFEKCSTEICGKKYDYIYPIQTSFAFLKSCFTIGYRSN